MDAATPNTAELTAENKQNNNEASVKFLMLQKIFRRRFVACKSEFICKNTSEINKVSTLDAPPQIRFFFFFFTKKVINY